MQSRPMVHLYPLRPEYWGSSAYIPAGRRGSSEAVTFGLHPEKAPSILAHEIAHIRQQRAGENVRTADSRDRFNLEARAWADALSRLHPSEIDPELVEDTLGTYAFDALADTPDREEKKRIDDSFNSVIEYAQTRKNLGSRSLCVNSPSGGSPMPMIASTKARPLTPSDQLLDICEEGEIVSAFTYPGFQSLYPDEEVNVSTITFVSAQLLGLNFIHDHMDDITAQIAQDYGEKVLAYIVCKQDVVEVSVPDQICLGEICWTPPFAGERIATGVQYRVTVISKVEFAAAGQFARAAVGVLAWGIVLILGFVVVIATLQIMSNKLKVQDLMSFVKDVLKSPGENISQALTGPLVAFGFAVVAASIAIPFVTSNIQATLPIPGVPGGSVRAGGTVTGGKR